MQVGRILIALIAVLLLQLDVIDGWADSTDRLRLIPQKGSHQFPFFEQPTQVWSYNGQLPGPTLRGQVGTTLTVEVVNRLDEPTSVHWHGLRIENAMDGVPGVTQDPIEPGDAFIYRLKLIEAGTFWYHPHLNAGEQMERGLKGVLIVEPKEKQPWSQDLVWLLDDWRLQKDGTIYPHFNTGHDLMHDGRWGNVATVNGKWKPTYNAIAGERIRLRLINGANARIFVPTFDGLTPRVIAVDGRPVDTVFPLDRFYLSPGNRVDLDIKIPTEAAGKMFLVSDLFTRKPFPLASIKISSEKAVKPMHFQVPITPDYIPASLFEHKAIAKTWDLNVVRGGQYGIGWAMNQMLWPEADTMVFGKQADCDSLTGAD